MCIRDRFTGPGIDVQVRELTEVGRVAAELRIGLALDPGPLQHVRDRAGHADAEEGEQQDRDDKTLTDAGDARRPLSWTSRRLPRLGRGPRRVGAGQRWWHVSARLPGRTRRS